jgi:thiol-disulfide isomerase/thioredoxin
MRLKRFGGLFVGLVFCFVLSVLFSPAYGSKGLPPGTTLAEFSMDVPESAEALEYLGLKEGKTFTLSQISGKLVLVEFYSMYCPVCQRQAPRTNKLYKFIEDDPVLNKDIKVIGVGLTNKQKEIDIYRKTFRVKFPLFADPDKAIAEKTGIKDIPLTVLLDKNGKVLLSHLGVIEKMDDFIKEIREIHKKQ